MKTFIVRPHTKKQTNNADSKLYSTQSVAGRGGVNPNKPGAEQRFIRDETKHRSEHAPKVSVVPHPETQTSPSAEQPNYSYNEEDFPPLEAALTPRMKRR